MRKGFKAENPPLFHKQEAGATTTTAAVTTAAENRSAKGAACENLYRSVRCAYTSIFFFKTGREEEKVEEKITKKKSGLSPNPRLLRQPERNCHTQPKPRASPLELCHLPRDATCRLGRQALGRDLSAQRPFLCLSLHPRTIRRCPCLCRFPVSLCVKLY